MTGVATTSVDATGLSPDDFARAILNVLEDVAEERRRQNDAQRATVNILEDVAEERRRQNDAQRATVNILEDVAEERRRQNDAQRATVNILEDVAEERRRQNDAQRATVNVLEDIAADRNDLSSTRSALVNILGDLEDERSKLDVVNTVLVSENEHRRLAQITLATQAEELERSNLDLEQFAYVASHDLQEPLRHISVFSEKLADRYSDVLDERGLRYLAYLVDGCAHMRQLIDGLMEFSRVGRSKPELHPIDLDRVMEAASGAVSERADEAGATITSGSLPHVLGDDDLLYRLFVNLLSNSIKFARADCPPVVTISAVPGPGGTWVIDVSDNGIGIDPAYRERAFDIFERLNGDDYVGTGIGLSVARRILEAHRGTIVLDDSPAGGTTVRMTFLGTDAVSGGAS